MPGTNAVAAKKALIARLQTDPSLEGIQVTYAWPGKRAERELVCGGKWRFAQRRGGYGSAREEDLTLDLFILVRTPGADLAEVEDRAVEIGALVEAVAADPSWWGDVPGLKLAGVTSGDSNPGIDDDSAVCELAYHVACTSTLR